MTDSSFSAEKGKRLFVCGATSAIALPVCRRLAADSASFFLVARNAQRLDRVAADLSTRGAARVETRCLDLTKTARHSDLVSEAFATFGEFDIAFLAHGILGDPSRVVEDPKEAEKVLQTNFTSAVSLLTLLANRFEKQRRGTIAVITSVAGDRGRKSNYVYGSAKAGLTVFLQGLRHRLHSAGVRVVAIKPGFILTPMTENLARKPLAVEPKRIAPDILRSFESGPEEVYTPWFWKPIMTAIRWIPEPLFKRLDL